MVNYKKSLTFKVNYKKSQTFKVNYKKNSALSNYLVYTVHL